MPTYVVSFESTHAAMAASKALGAAGAPYYNIPTPRAISAGCGIAVKFEADDPEPAVACMLGAILPAGESPSAGLAETGGSDEAAGERRPAAELSGIASLYLEHGRDDFELVRPL